MLDCVSAYSKALNLHWTKAFGEGCVKSKTKVKQNLFVVVIDYYKKLHLKQFQEKKKECPKKVYDTILSKSHLLSTQTSYNIFYYEYA